MTPRGSSVEKGCREPGGYELSSVSAAPPASSRSHFRETGEEEGEMTTGSHPFIDFFVFKAVFIYFTLYQRNWRTAQGISCQRH